MASVERGMKRKKKEEKVEEENLNESDEGDRGFRSALRAMREKKEWTDVVLVCDGDEIHVHGVILASQSPYFQNIFHNDFKESKTKRVDYSHVKKDVMLVILDYIYLNSVENIPDEDVQSLINIIQVSHQLQMKRLNERCWKLILNQINADNWLNIWELVLLHENDEGIIQTLHFILNHLSEIVKKNFFNLNRLQLVTLMEKINENNLPMEDKFLETIIEWNKKTKEKNFDLQEIFLKINYHFISRKFMNNLMENEKDLFQDTFFQFFKQHFLPTLKTYPEVQSYKKTFSPILTGKISLQFFYFGCYMEEFNKCILYKNAGLRIFDCEKQSVCKIIDNLPFLFGRGIFPIQHGSDIYIIGGIPSGIAEPVASKTTKSFFLYDWKNNRVVEKPSLLEGVYYPTVYATENNIYVFQLDYSNDVYTIFQYYSFSEQKWFARTYTNFGVVACASVKKIMYLLCYEDNSGYYCLYTVNQLEFTFHSNTPVPYFEKSQDSTIHVNQRMITVYKDKVFILSNKPNHSWYIFDPNTQLWDIIGTSFECVEHTSIEFSIYCFDNGNNSLMFYNINDRSIYQFDENNEDMKKVMTVKGQLDKTWNGTYKKYEQWLFFKSSF